jgi:DNA topoisomerase-1
MKTEKILSSLVIVESPAKAKTIKKILGEEFYVSSCMGHVVDLPKKELGVDIENNFKPKYLVIPGKKKVLKELKRQVEDKEKVYLATDPDREGEAIAWHLSQKLNGQRRYLRVAFREITAHAVREAFQNPTDIDQNRVNAQQARRILDRLVGYFLSPLLWKRLTRGLSAGRVQSVALKLVVEREREIREFKPQEYWEIEAKLKKQNAETFSAKLEKIEDKKAKVEDKEQADRIIKELKGGKFLVSDIRERPKKKNPPAPFITSTLQQEAFNKLRFNAHKTMIVAQQLYEGVELGKEGPIGLITYMRTDSPRLSTEALAEIRQFITEAIGKEYLPEQPNIYKSKKTAQEAHEAIRPTQLRRKPQDLKEFLTPEQYKLYDLIWKRTVASQMKPAQLSVTTIDISCGKYLFRATGSRVVFRGFTVLYQLSEAKEPESQASLLPQLTVNEVLELVKLVPSQHFTRPPARYTDATLVRTLEEKGIGRPSTYAPIIQIIVSRNYVRRLEGYLVPTELGEAVVRFLVKLFPEILDVKFTARIEEKLDEIEQGRLNWTDVLVSFYRPFSQSLNVAQQNLKKEVFQTEERCQDCGRPMVIKWSKQGKFLSCSGFPKCKNARPLSSGVKCPRPGCDGELIQRRSRKGSIFYGCSNFPKCRYTTRKLP